MSFFGGVAGGVGLGKGVIWGAFRAEDGCMGGEDGDVDEWEICGGLNDR